jgi:hypothetical protein
MDAPSLSNIGDFEIEAQQETPLFQEIKGLILRFRDRIFSKKKDQVETKEEKVPETDEQWAKWIYDKYGLKNITPHELSEIRRSAKMSDLTDNAGILKFISTNYNILFDLDKIHSIEKRQADKLRDPLEQKRWQAEVDKEIGWALATYSARYSAKQLGNYNEIIDQPLRLRLTEDEDVEQKVEVAPESQSNVIRLADHKPIQPKPSKKPEDDEPEPIEPEVHVA